MHNVLFHISTQGCLFMGHEEGLLSVFLKDLLENAPETFWMQFEQSLVRSQCFKGLLYLDLDLNTKHDF